MGNIMSLTRSGLKDFFIQRVTALFIMYYALFMIVLLLCISSKSHGMYETWSTVFSYTWMKVFTILAFISLIAHAWVGMWTIFTDYIESALISGILQVAMILGFLSCFVWLCIILFETA